MKKALEEARWTRAFINDLPDSAFAVVLPGGEKDEEGKTVPRDLRKLPHHTPDVGEKGHDDSTVDLPHLRNALARLPLTDMPEEYRERARRHLERHAEALGIGDRGERQEESLASEPFGPYKDFADCVAKNSDKADPEAYCAVLQRRMKPKEESDHADVPKVSPDRVNLRDAASGYPSCQGCVYYYPSLAACAVVEGSIPPLAICDLFDGRVEDWEANDPTAVQAVVERMQAEGLPGEKLVDIVDTPFERLAVLEDEDGRRRSVCVHELVEEYLARRGLVPEE